MLLNYRGFLGTCLANKLPGFNWCIYCTGWIGEGMCKKCTFRKCIQLPAPADMMAGHFRASSVLRACAMTAANFRITDSEICGTDNFRYAVAEI